MIQERKTEVGQWDRAKRGAGEDQQKSKHRGKPEGKAKEKEMSVKLMKTKDIRENNTTRMWIRSRKGRNRRNIYTGNSLPVQKQLLIKRKQDMLPKGQLNWVQKVQITWNFWNKLKPEWSGYENFSREYIDPVLLMQEKKKICLQKNSAHLWRY